MGNLSVAGSVRSVGVIAVFLFVGSLMCFGQTDLSFHRINVDNGLPQNTVMSILQDRTGYVWFSTNDGLCRFDGIEFKIYKYREGDEKTLSSNQITKVFEDHNGNVWIGTFNGLNLYDREKDCFIRCRFGVKNKRHNIQAIAEGKNGIMWAGSQKGLFCYEPKKQNNRAIDFNHFTAVKGAVHSILIDSNKRLWLGAAQQLVVYDLVKKQNIPLSELVTLMPAFESQVNDIKYDSKKRYWVATESLGVFLLDLSSKTCKKYSITEGLSSNTVRAVSQDKTGQIWIGTKKGLNIINATDNSIRHYFNAPYDESSISQNSIRSILEDREGNIWLGTYSGGVNVIYKNAKKFSILRERLLSKTGLSNGSVNTMVEDEDGSLWVGTDEGGLNHVSKNLGDISYHYPEGGNGQPSLANSVKALANDGNTLWVGTGSGLFRFNKKTSTFLRSTIVERSKNHDLIQKYVFSKNGPTLWIGTSFNGLWRVDSGKLSQHYNWNEHDKSKFRSGNITALAEAGNFLWVGTQSQGISSLDLTTKKISNYIHGKGNTLSDNGIISLFAEPHGLYIGTRSGLNYLNFRERRFYQINDQHQTLTTTIYSIRKDASGALWISSNKGIYCLRTKNGAFDPKNFELANYSYEDGLPSNEFSANSSLATRDGNLIFGGIKGLTRFHPMVVGSNPVVPAVVLTGFDLLSKTKSDEAGSPLHGKNIETVDKVVLRHDQNLFSIKYAALNYLNASKNTFAYKLEGLGDDDWHDVGNQRIVTFTNLNPGLYTFRVKAANNDGVWNTIPKTLLIEVLPPWWLSNYAYGVYLIIIIALFYVYDQYTKKSERAKAQIRFKADSLQKDKELAQQKINFFLNVSHEIKTPLTMVLAPLDKLLRELSGDRSLSKYLSLMHRNGDRLLRMVNQMLDIQKFDEGGMTLQITQGHAESLIRETMRSFEALAELKSVKLSYCSSHKELEGWFDKEKLETVLYNLLSNAIKFSPFGGTVCVDCNIDESGPKFLTISVSDDGRGIETSKLALIFDRFYHENSQESDIKGTGLGLAYSKALVDIHHGNISVSSRTATAEQTGHTVFSVKLPFDCTAYPAGVLVDRNLEVETLNNDEPHNQPALLNNRREAIVSIHGNDRLQMLVAEDNEELCHFIRDTFSPYFDVQTAGNGLRAWQLITEKIPDIIISDVMMPGMTGIELCQHVKTDIRTSHIPLILLTARAALQHKMEGLDTGADDYVTKPFVTELLEARVWNLIGSRQQLRSRYQKEVLLEPRHVVINNLDEQFLKRTISAIERHLDDPDFTVDNLSEEMAMGRATFTRKIKALTNRTPLEFIRDIRLKMASQLLAQGQYNVSEVASMVGFLDVNYFRKCFKEQFNTTPKAHFAARI